MRRISAQSTGIIAYKTKFPINFKMVVFCSVFEAMEKPGKVLEEFRPVSKGCRNEGIGRNWTELDESLWKERNEKRSLHFHNPEKRA